MEELVLHPLVFLMPCPSGVVVTASAGAGPRSENLCATPLNGLKDGGVVVPDAVGVEGIVLDAVGVEGVVLDAVGVKSVVLDADGVVGVVLGLSSINLLNLSPDFAMALVMTSFGWLSPKAPERR